MLEKRKKKKIVHLKSLCAVKCAAKIKKVTLFKINYVPSKIFEIINIDIHAWKKNVKQK